MIYAILINHLFFIFKIFLDNFFIINFLIIKNIEINKIIFVILNLSFFEIIYFIINCVLQFVKKNFSTNFDKGISPVTKDCQQGRTFLAKNCQKGPSPMAIICKPLRLQAFQQCLLLMLLLKFLLFSLLLCNWYIWQLYIMLFLLTP